MKQNIIMVIILVALFFFGLLIYDFSDELDSAVTSHDWYLLDDDEMVIISFKNQKFSYYYQSTGESLSSHELCLNYRFNRSINVIKLNCNTKGNKLYISSITENEFKLTIDNVEKTFYASEAMAQEAAFRKENNLSKEDFLDLMNIDLNKFTITTVDDVVNLYKSKNIKLVAFVNEEKSIKNALNLKTLYNLSSNSEKTLLIINYKDLLSVELAKLIKLNNKFPKDIKDFDRDSISIYIVGKKSFELVTNLSINAFKEVNDYNNI
ncbi:MAG: hypothetical protein PHF21_02135 [Bacilli bacterium]|nr:hypothetical protein [Bacilli bacterium]